MTAKRRRRRRSGPTKLLTCGPACSARCSVPQLLRLRPVAGAEPADQQSADASRRALLMSAFTKIPLQLLVLFLGCALFVRQGPAPNHCCSTLSTAPRPKTLTGDARARFDAAAARHADASARRREALQQVAAGHAEAVTGLQQAALAAADRAAMPGAKPNQPERRKDSNFVFTDFLFRDLPKPVLGLMIAAIFAAAISSAAGRLSSLTSATMIDLYRRWLAPQGTNSARAHEPRGDGAVGASPRRCSRSRSTTRRCSRRSTSSARSSTAASSASSCWRCSCRSRRAPGPSPACSAASPRRSACTRRCTSPPLVQTCSARWCASRPAPWSR